MSNKSEKKDVKEKEKDKDVKDKDVKDKDVKDKEKPKEEPPLEVLYRDLSQNIATLIEAVALKEKRLFNRVIRKNNSVRKRTSLGILSHFATKYHPDLLNFLDLVKNKLIEPSFEVPPAAAAQEAKEAKEREEKKTPPVNPQNVEPEVKVYLHLLGLLFLIDRGFKQEASQCATALVTFLQSYNRRTLDQLSGSVYYYYSLAFENLGQLASIRSHLLLLHRTSCLQHNEPGQASLTNCILRNYLHYNLINQADQFRQATSSQVVARSNNQLARYLYYIGKINSIQQHYAEAYNNIIQAIRKAPQSAAVGFRQAAYKLLSILQLLMGEIPERANFKLKGLSKALHPYFLLTQAVRVGDLVQFNKVVAEHKQTFIRDKIYSLIIRLRHNVIKTGLRKINVSYSRISIKDICQKLNLDNEEDAEYIVAKAIHDGVINAVIDRKQRFVFSRENTDIYSTQEPQAAFHKRVEFCMEIHDNAIKAMRFPPGAHKSASELEREEAERKKAEEEKEPEKDKDKGKGKGKDKAKDDKAKDDKNKEKEPSKKK